MIFKNYYFTDIKTFSENTKNPGTRGAQKIDKGFGLKFFSSETTANIFNEFIEWNHDSDIDNPVFKTPIIYSNSFNIELKKPIKIEIPGGWNNEGESYGNYISFIREGLKKFGDIDTFKESLINKGFDGVVIYKTYANITDIDEPYNIVIPFNFKKSVKFIEQRRLSDNKHLQFMAGLIEGIEGNKLKTKRDIELFVTMLINLKGAADAMNVENTKIASAPNSTTMKASVSGTAINYSFNDIHRAGYYGFDKPYIINIQIGGGLELELKRAIEIIMVKFLSKYSFESDLGESKIVTDTGTNYNSVMLTAPTKDGQYSAITELPKIYFEKLRKLK